MKQEKNYEKNNSNAFELNDSHDKCTGTMNVSALESVNNNILL